MGWWITRALEVGVVGTLERSPPCRSCRVPHLRAWPQRVDRVRTKYTWPLFLFRLVSPVGHFHSPPDTAAVVKYCALYYFNLMVHVSKRGRPVTLACQPPSLRPYDFKGPQLSTCIPPTCLSQPSMTGSRKPLRARQSTHPSRRHRKSRTRLSHSARTIEKPLIRIIRPRGQRRAHRISPLRTRIRQVIQSLKAEPARERIGEAVSGCDPGRDVLI
jgi:hypothetical protein